MKRIELEGLLADRETVRLMIEGLGSNDPIGRYSFGARLASIDEQIEKLASHHETVGSVALLFSGSPVHGSRSIEADFASTVLKSFQDLVTKQVASEEFGKLGSRGRVREGTSSTLAIRELVRGSVGFVLEEVSENQELVDTPVKKAIDEVTAIIGNVGGESDAEFESSVETLDARMLVSLRTFFQAMDDSKATVRIVEEKREAALDSQAVHRARLRVEATEVQDIESEMINGELLGLLPESRKFEMKLLESGEIIKGSVSASLATDWLELIEKPGEKFVGEVWRTKMRVREVRERNRVPRTLYTLLGLIERRELRKS